VIINIYDPTFKGIGPYIMCMFLNSFPNIHINGNVDASFSNSLNRTGIGMCIRDAEGTVVWPKPSI
jgi:hypothetical protein